MDTFIAVVFDDEVHAFKGAEALKDLHGNGDLVVYAAAVIAKDAEGNVSIKQGTDVGPIGTAFGVLTGALVGVLAGPMAVASGAVAAGTAAASAAAVSGMAAGSIIGGTFGMFRDLYEAGIGADVLDKLNSELAPGKSAVVAAVDEVWTTPLDVKMKEAGGIVFRKLRIDIVDEQIERDIAASDAELKQLQAEFDAADAETREWIQSKIDTAKANLTALDEKARNRLTKLNDEFNARVTALDAQIKTAVADAKTKLEQRKAALITDFNTRKDKLQKAAALAGEALS